MRLSSLPNNQPWLLLHAGCPKSGTDSIQRFFGYYARSHFSWVADYFELLQCSDFASTNLSGLTAKIEYSSNSLEATTVHGCISKQTLQRHHPELISKNFIFSSEHAGRPSLTPTLAKKQHHFLQLYSQDPYVLYYIRNPFDQCLAMIEQTIKEGFNCKDVLSQFLECKPNMNNVLIFDALYGDSHVLCVPFNRQEFVDGNVLLDFCQRIGVSDRLVEIEAFASAFQQTNRWLPLTMLKLLQKVNHRVCIPSFSRVHLINSLSDCSFSGRRSVHSDFMTSEQILCLLKSTRDEYDALATYLDFQPYTMPGPMAEEHQEVSSPQNDLDHVANSNALFSAGDRVWARLERFNVINEPVYIRPPLSNMGPVGAHESLKNYITSLTSVRLQNSFSPRVMCEISLDYVINVSHAWAEHKKTERTSKT